MTITEIETIKLGTFSSSHYPKMSLTLCYLWLPIHPPQLIPSLSTVICEPSEGETQCQWAVVVMMMMMMVLCECRLPWPQLQSRAHSGKQGGKRWGWGASKGKGRRKEIEFFIPLYLFTPPPSILSPIVSCSLLLLSFFFLSFFLPLFYLDEGKSHS